MSHAVSPRPIHALADDLINQIAAGEVIERPASIVKELIENSLDAGASAIKIELAAGGVDYISVSDDGHGIPPLELGLALRRHCTSKITRFADLDRIVSLGFRGEALASIGAVADLTLMSRTRDSAHAWSVSTGPRRDIQAPIPAARPPGTTVLVRDLFGAIPARRQFLRRPQTELLHIQQLLRGVAFCVPGVAFSLRYDAKQWTAPAARDERSNQQRWQAVFGAPFARDALYLDVTSNDIRLYGWIGPAEFARNQADLQYLAVNGRLIRDRQLSHAIRLAYGTALGPGQFATYALHLEVAPDDVDVNVHPSKAEVRFRRIREVHDLLYAAIRQAFTPSTMLDAGARYAQSPGSEQQRHFQIAEHKPAPALASRAAVTGPSSDTAHETSDIIANRFLIQIDGDALKVVDLQRFIAAHLDQPSPLTSRVLLFPVRMPTSPATPWRQLSRAGAHWGFEFDEVGADIWVLRGVPSTLPEFAIEQFATILAADKDAQNTPGRAFSQAIGGALTPPIKTDCRRWFRDWCQRAEALGVKPSVATLGLAALTTLCAASPTADDRQ